MPRTSNIDDNIDRPNDTLETSWDSCGLTTNLYARSYEWYAMKNGTNVYDISSGDFPW